MISGDEIKKNISKNIVKYREKVGLSQKELAQKLNTTSSRISNWEQGSNCPTIDILFEVCRVLNVSINDIYGVYPDSEMTLSYDEQECIKKYRFISEHSPEGIETINYILDREYKIADQLRKTTEYNAEPAAHIYPYLGKIACAGTGFYFDDIPTDTIEAPYVEGADFIIGVSGESMEPDYHDGEKLYVRKVEYLRNGDIGIFTIGNQCFLKELGEDGLISRNKNYDDIPEK